MNFRIFWPILWPIICQSDRSFLPVREFMALGLYFETPFGTVSVPVPLFNAITNCQSYADIQTGFESLIKRGEHAAVKTLALMLMKRGSLQVECSDEGLMCEEIEGCLKPVLKAVKSADSDGGRAWAKDMLSADRVGFICDSKLRKMAG